MFCSNCGTKVKGKASFCQSCGKSIDKGKATTLAERTVSEFMIANLFKGRIGRKEWVLGIILLIGMLFATAFLIASISEYLILLIPLYIVYAVFLFSLHIRRLHDLNYSGWVALVFSIPIANLILLLILTLSSGKEIENRYGKKLDPNAKLLDVLLGKVN